MYIILYSHLKDAKTSAEKTSVNIVFYFSESFSRVKKFIKDVSKKYYHIHTYKIHILLHICTLIGNFRNKCNLLSYLLF